MSAAQTVLAVETIDVTNQQLALLRRGAANQAGMIMTAFEAKSLKSIFSDLKCKGLIHWYWPGIPAITYEGRDFVKARDLTDGTLERRRREALAEQAERKRKYDEEQPARDQAIKDFNRWDRLRMQGVLIVRHDHPSTAAIKASRCGNASACTFLPLAKIEIRPISTERFLLVMVPDWLRKKLPPEYSERTPDLFGDGWAESERDSWKSLSQRCGRLNYEMGARWRRQSHKTHTRTTPW